MKIAVVGDIGIDYYKNLDILKPGGIAFNFAYGLISSGKKSISLISVLGNDSHSKLLIKLIKKMKIKSDNIQIIKGSVPIQNILLKNGERKFVGYSAGILKKWKLRKKDLDFIVKNNIVFIPLSDGMEHIFDTVKKIKGSIKAVDFSQDYEFADFDKKENVITKNAKYFDIIFVGGEKKHKDMIQKLSKKYPEKVFVLTLGKTGSLGFHKNEEYFEPAKNVNVVDTTGAGDAFESAFLSTYLKTKNVPESLKSATIRASDTIGYIGSNIFKLK